jgi:secreted trypsin-like serine protease
MDIKMISLFLLSLCVTMIEQKTYRCDPKVSCGCSLNSPSVNARIINGETASTGTWSWVASLRIGKYICGGSIISDSYIMTAGHCVTNTSANQITAYLGSTELFKGNFQYVSRIYLHPRFYIHPSENYCLHDIALLKLSTPLNMNDKILTKVCLPKRNTTIADNTDLIAIGWGKTYEDNDYASETLQQVTVKAINSTSTWCKSITYDVRIQFCAGIMPYGGKGEEI